MNPKHYCDLEWSKRLKEAGFPQGKSEFVWYAQISEYGQYTGEYAVHTRGSAQFSQYDFAAPISDEILEELPHSIKIKTKKGICTYWLCFEKLKSFAPWVVIYQSKEDNKLYIQQNIYDVCRGNFLCHALAAMYEYLSKNGLLKKG